MGDEPVLSGGAQMGAESAASLTALKWVASSTVLLLALGGWYVLQREEESRARERFDITAFEALDSIRDRVHTYEQVLRGGVGLFAVVGEVSRPVWREYVASLQIEQRYPGIQGIGFSKHIAPAEIDQHVRQIRSEGFAQYSVSPAGERAQYTAIIYLEPFSGRNLRAFGYDMLTEPVRRAAMERARDEGRTMLSGKVALMQETERDVQAGFLIYLPVYRGGSIPGTPELRRAALLGYVCSPFRMDDFVRGAIGLRSVGVNVEIFDGPDTVPDARLYSPERLARKPRHQRVETVDIFERKWTFQFSSLPGFEAGSVTYLPESVFVLGALISALLFGVLHVEDIHRRRGAESAERLRQSHEALERSNLDLQRFAYVASHDLQTPMRGIASFVGLLRADYADKLDAQAGDWLRRIEQAVEQLQVLVRDLLEYARVDSQAHALEPVPLRVVFDHALSLLEAGVRETGAEIACGELPTVMGDRSQLVQLMLNLIGNALIYRGAERPRINVGAELKDGEWTVSVADNGIGIAPRHQERIFEIFQRLHDQQAYPGSGIGLAVCRRVVHRHGGRIWVESEEGRGSTFYFTISERKASTP